MRAAILSVGTELITGQTVDTNSAWLSARLHELGVCVTEHVTVGDCLGDIREAIIRLLNAGGLTIITGGLGPTADDLTREALAQALDVPLEEDRAALAAVEAFFARRARPMPDSNRLQALVPRGCTVVENRLGTAPGLGHRSADGLLFALPGVPGEMKAMFEAAIVPEVLAVVGQVRGCTRVLRTFGMSEAHVGELLADLMRPRRNPAVGTTASRAVISVRIVARAQNEAQAKHLAEADADVIRTRLGTALFGEGETTLQDAVGQALMQQGRTVATAESCTGGLLAKMLTDVPGSSRYFKQGYITYANEAKSALLGVAPEIIAREGAVSEAVARALAFECRERSSADHALATTGIAGPTGGTPDKPVGLVFIGLADAEGVQVKRLLLGESLSREEIRDRACKTVLNMLRLKLSL